MVQQQVKQMGLFKKVTTEKEIEKQIKELEKKKEEAKKIKEEKEKKEQIKKQMSETEEVKEFVDDENKEDQELGDKILQYAEQYGIEETLNYLDSIKNQLLLIAINSKEEDTQENE